MAKYDVVLSVDKDTNNNSYQINRSLIEQTEQARNVPPCSENLKFARFSLWQIQLTCQQKYLRLGYARRTPLHQISLNKHLWILDQHKYSQLRARAYYSLPFWGMNDSQAEPQCLLAGIAGSQRSWNNLENLLTS